MSVTPPVAAPELVVHRRFLAGWLSRFRGVDALGKICIGVVIILAIIAVFGPALAPKDPNAIDLLNSSAGPSSAHWLGTDDTGRDIFSRLLVGARTTLLGSAAIVVLAFLVGVSLALFSAWWGGGLDRVVGAVVNILFAFPALLLAILAAAILGIGLTTVIIALSIAYTPYVARVVRSAALRERNLAYVEALGVLGAGGLRITFRHILPNVWPLIRAQMTLTYGYAVIDLTAISFLGLGVQPPSSDWGVMVADGQEGLLSGSPWQAIFAGVAIIITVLAVTLLGNRQADRAGADR